MDPVRKEEVVLKRIKTAVYYLDECFELPYIRLKFGWDSIIGLLPFYGDLVAAILSMYVIMESVLLNTPRAVLVRMMMNLGLSFSIGVIPLFGDLFVAFYQANRRNASLLTRYLEHPEKTERGSKRWIILMLIGIFSFFALIAFIFIWATYQFFSWLFTNLLGPTF